MGREFTPENHERITHATHGALHDHPQAGNGIVIGYDNRRNSDTFALQAAEVLRGLGWRVFLSQESCPTPAVSLAVVERKAAAGIVITASHNPPEFNGFKVKGDFGGPAPAELISRIERSLDQPSQRLGNSGRIERCDLQGPHLAHLARFIDLEAIRRSGLRLAYHAMHGAGLGLLSKLLPEQGVFEYQPVRDPSFRGIAPEPTAENTKDFRAEVRKQNRFDLGLITDGDADRIGLCNPQGDYVDAQLIFSIALEHLVEHRGLTGKVCKTYAVTERVDRIAQRFSLPLEVLPIGFKHVAARMQVEPVLMGGEEAGGLGVSAYLPERDGLMMGLLIAECMVKRGLDLNALIADLQERYGALFYERIDARLEPEERDRLLARWTAPGPKEVAGHRVVRFEQLDGIKFFFENGGWLLVRASGTEPLIRLYCEMPSLEETRRVLAEARASV
jgi:phosphomannomutase